MADVVPLLLILLAISLAVWVLVSNHNKRLEPTPRRWTLDDAHPDGKGNVVVRCVCPGEPSLTVGDPVPWDDPDFESLIEERRSEGYLRLAALNSRNLLGR